MYSFLDKTLGDSLSENGKLKDNHVAINLYRLLKDNDFKCSNWDARKIFLELRPNMSIKADITEYASRSSEILDYRFKSVNVKGVKKFPATLPTQYYSLNSFFESDASDTICSSVFIGKNGVGKTSFYGALEMLSMGKMYTADLRGETAENFIRNVSTEPKDVAGILETASPVLVYPTNTTTQEKTVPAFFCSEKDVRDLESMKKISDFLFEQLGIKDYNILLMLLSEAIEQAATIDNAYKGLCHNIDKAVEEIACCEIIILYRTSPERIEQITNRLNADDNLVKSSIDKISPDNEQGRSTLLNQIERSKAYLDTEFRYLASIAPDFDKLPGTKKINEELQNIEKTINDYASNSDISKEKSILDSIENYNRQLSDLANWRHELAQRILSSNDIKNIDIKNIFERLAKAFTELKGLTDQKSDPQYAVAEYYEQWKDQISEIHNYLYHCFSCLLNDKFRKVLDNVFTPLLQSCLEDDESIKPTLSPTIEQNDNKKEITLDIELLVEYSQKDENTGLIKSMCAETTPTKYFNTFRFKLFAVALKLSLACCAKLIYNENWPIVIDDIFDSSDFNNRSEINEFIYKLIEAYNTIDELKIFPFQLIFFTQDEIVGDAVFRGLKESQQKSMLARIQDYRAFTEDEVKDWKNNDKRLIVADIIKSYE